MSDPKYHLLNQYRRYILNHYKETFLCPQCYVCVEPQSFETHCDTHHDFDSKTRCVWCDGKVSWPKGKKYDHMPHVYRCAEHFFKNPAVLRETPSSSSPRIRSFGFETIVVSDIEPAEPPFFTQVPIDDLSDPFILRGYLDIPRKKDVLSFSKPPTFASVPHDGGIVRVTTDSLFHSPHEIAHANRLTFDGDSLNEAVYCVRYYEETTRIEFNTFHHVAIRHVACPSFNDAMTQYDRGHTKVLPFYCWCDGCDDVVEAKYRRHIHMIVASRGNHFMKHVWPHVSATDQPRHDYECKHSKRIVSTRQLIQSLGYLSGREPKCVAFGSADPSERPLWKHFYLSKTLPREYQLYLATQYDDGLKELVEHLYRNHVPDVDDAGLEKDPIDGRWKMKYKYLPSIHRNLVLKVDSRFVPLSENETTNAWMCLNEGRQLYFIERNDDAEFSAIDQAIRGNVFMNFLENDRLVFRPKTQTLLNQIERSVNRAVLHRQSVAIEHLRDIIDALQQTVDGRRSKIDRLKNIVRERDAQMAQTKEEEMDHLKRTLEARDSKITELERIIADMRHAKDAEIDVLKKTVGSLKRVISTISTDENEAKRMRLSDHDPNGHAIVTEQRLSHETESGSM